MMKLRFLGTGTSLGVPKIGCRCAVCRSQDSRDKRMRTSALLTCGDKRLLIDCGPDFRRQIISAGAPRLDAVLLTHTHYDHTGGLDDLRPYCQRYGAFPLYCRQDVAVDLRRRIPYCFSETPYPNVPSFDMHTFGDEAFYIGDIEVLPLPVMHYRLPIVGFRIGGFAYITDAKTIPGSTYERLEGVHTLVINALRHTEAFAHMTLREALDAVERIKPGRAYLTHMADKIGFHAGLEASLPEGVYPAYDGLEIDIM